MTVPLGPQGTLVTGSKTKPVTVKSISETPVVNLRLRCSTNGPCCGARRSVLVTGFYGARYFVGMFVTGVTIEARGGVLDAYQQIYHGINFARW
jgi:hypothetical protein